MNFDKWLSLFSGMTETYAEFEQRKMAEIAATPITDEDRDAIEGVLDMFRPIFRRREEKREAAILKQRRMKQRQAKRLLKRQGLAYIQLQSLFAMSDDF